MQWSSIQSRLDVTSDGKPGPQTYNALLSRIAGRTVDPNLGTTLAANADAYGLNTEFRLAEFIAECSHESSGFQRLVENLRYTADRLHQVWPGRFPTVASAAPFVSNPQALANRVYGGRMGNTASGDGWLYRGRGIIMLTGRANYASFGSITGLDLIRTPDLASQPGAAMLLALAFWRQKSCNMLCDRQDWDGVRRSVNGGAVGLNDVGSIRAKALAILS